MSGDLIAGLPRRIARRGGFTQTALEKRGLKLDIGAPVTAAVTVGDAVAASFGDGTVRIFRADLPPVVAHAHHGATLCMAAAEDHVVTGGDDGRFVRVALSGQVEELASFGTRWVDCVATSRARRACSSGRIACVWSKHQAEATRLEHPSTVGGLAFDAAGKRLAVSHYGGVTVWKRGERRWKARKLGWHGSHGGVCFSPDGRFVVSAMQENACHVWRLRDAEDMEMPGYPSKIKHFAWVGDTPHLATSGADEAVCWPFDGKNGPLRREPLCVAHGGKQIATIVRALPGEPAVVVGFQDGAVLLGELDESVAPVVLRGTTGTPVTAIAFSGSRSHMLVGDSDGGVLWTRLVPTEHTEACAEPAPG